MKKNISIPPALGFHLTGSLDFLECRVINVYTDICKFSFRTARFLQTLACLLLSSDDAVPSLNKWSAGERLIFYSCYFQFRLFFKIHYPKVFGLSGLRYWPSTTISYKMLYKYLDYGSRTVHDDPLLFLVYNGPERGLWKQHNMRVCLKRKRWLTADRGIRWPPRA